MEDPMTQERRSLLDSELDGPVPELKVEQVVQSSDSVIKFEYANTVNEGEALIQPYGDYTVVIGKGIPEIQIFDKQGKKIEGLENTSTMIVNWAALHKSSGNIYYHWAIDTSGMHVSNRAGYLGVEYLPQKLQPFITQYIRNESPNHNTMVIPDGTWQLSTAKAGQMAVCTGEDFLIIRQQDNGMFIAFQTKTAQGIDLPPRNWKRFDNTDQYIGNLPADIKTEYDNLSLEGVVNLTESENRFIMVYKDHILFVKSGQKIEEADFKDKIARVDKNVTIDPRNSDIIYYCSSDNPRNIIKVDTSNADPALWQTEALDLPQQYEQITNLKLDPSGHFFTFESEGEFVILSRANLKEVKKVPNLFSGKLDSQGRIRGIDKEGHLVIYDVNFQKVTQELEKRRLARLAQGLSVDLFKKEGAAVAKVELDQFQHLMPVKTDLEAQFNDQLSTISNLEDMTTISEALTKLCTRLQSEGLQPVQIVFITQGIQDSIVGKERILAAPVVAQGLVDLNTKLAGNLTIATITEAKGDIAKLKALEGFVDDSTRAQIRTLESQYEQQSAELFRREGVVVERDVTEMVNGVRAELDQIVSMPDFADWQEFRFPQLVSRLGSLANDVPLEASETQKKILAARRQLQELSREYETKFKERYAQVREKASEVMGERVELIRTEMDSLVDRLRGRGFKDRNQVEGYIKSSEALEVLRTEIAELAARNPDIAKKLDRDLKVRLATIMSEIERGGLTSIAETGQQMVLFGDTPFPKWEGKVQEKIRRHMDLVFIAEDRSKGVGVSAEKIFGDVGIMEINSRGKVEKKRLYEGMQEEDEWRLGAISYRGEYVLPSYISQAEYRKLKRDYADWSRGDDSKIRQGLNEKRQALRKLYHQRPPGWREEYRELLQDYAKFSAENHVVLLSRVDQLRQAPETEFANGSGYIPEWQSHWTVDDATEHYLEEMAKLSKMQLDLQEGLVNLKGHAGTGKDVLVKMFCHRTNRPYFAVDCSKWTTEFELSEDVVLEAKDGASQTIKVPSAVLNAITTPGAVMYFNEINAMPEQAQIFLHGLMDEKRTLTLKTSSGKAIKILPSVILMGSMNPGYPGTFKPQFATESRFIPIEINYPPLHRERGPNDPNPNPPISAAEALRVARQVDSLADFTYEANPEHNEFVQIWDKYVNGIQNGAPDLNQVQRFDIEAILTMVEFAQKLREGFILKFEKRSASEIKGKLTVDQPITGREMRRMAYSLSKMSAEEKATANPEMVVRGLIERFFLSHIDNQKERDEIKTAMATWTSAKRPAA